MKHLQDAFEAMKNRTAGTVKFADCITVKGQEVSFCIQDGPIKEVGNNGIQVTDMVEL